VAPAEASHTVFFDIASSEDGWIGFGAEPSVNNSQTVAFISRKTGEPLGIYTSSRPGEATKIADLSEEVSGLRFSSFTSNALISNDGSVTFLANLDTGERGIYQGTPGGVSTVEDNSGDFSFFQNPSVNSFGEVVFKGTRFGVSGVYVASGGATGFVEDTSGPRKSFGPPVISDDGVVGYTAFRDTGGSGIFLGAPPATIAPLFTTDDPENFIGFGDPAINREYVAFIAADSSNDVGIYAADFDRIWTIAHEDDGFSNLTQPAITDYNEIVYFGSGSFGVKGIYYDLGAGIGSGRLIGTGDDLFGSTVTGLDFEADGVSNLGSVVFSYGLADGRFGIAGAPLPLPLTNGGFEDEGPGGGGGGPGIDDGEIFGWDVSGTNADGDPVDTPHITTQTSEGGNTFLQLKTGQFEDGILTSTISQSFVVHEDAALLNFNLTIPVFEDDPTGTGASALNDRIEVSLEADGVRYMLLVMGIAGVEVGPFDPAFPGALLISESPDDEFDLTFSADLSDFIDVPVAVYIDVINEDDVLLLDPNLDDFQLTAVPEPCSLLVLGIATLGLTARRPRRVPRMSSMSKPL